MLFTEDRNLGRGEEFLIWCKCITPYPASPTWNGRSLIAIFQLKNERDRFFEALKKQEKEVTEVCQNFENQPYGMGRKKPSTEKERLLNKIQKECGIKDT